MEIKDNYQRIDITLIDPNPWNPNEQTDFMFDKQKVSMSEFGSIVPIIVREKNGRYEIVDGEHRYKASLQLGAKQISVNNLGKVDDHVVMRLTDILNSLKGKNNQDKLAELLNSLKNEVSVEELIRTMPYQESEIQAMISHTEIDWKSIEAEIKQPQVLQTVLDKPKIVDSPYKNEWVIGESNGYSTRSIRIPKEEMDELEFQINRIKKLLYPEENPIDVSEESAWAGIIQALLQTKDVFFIGNQNG